MSARPKQVPVKPIAKGTPIRRLQMESQRTADTGQQCINLHLVCTFSECVAPASSSGDCPSSGGEFSSGAAVGRCICCNFPDSGACKNADLLFAILSVGGFVGFEAICTNADAGTSESLLLPSAASPICRSPSPATLPLGVRLGLTRRLA